jgi:hypothetical protein
MSGTVPPGKAAPRSIINLSRDLVRLHIASRNLTPDDKSLDARPLFGAAVKYAKAHGTRKLTIDHGAYYLLTPQDATSYLRLAALSDLTVDLADSTIYFADAFHQGLALVDCHRLTLTNFRVDFLVLPYTQVRLESVDPDHRTLSYSSLPNWADPVSFNGATSMSKPLTLWAAVFRNGDIVPGTSRMRVVEPIARNTLQLAQDPAPWAQSPVILTLKAGDTMIVTQRGGPPPVLVFRGDFVTVSNATIYGSSGIAMLLTLASHSTVDHVRVTPRPGVGLISANADGIHLAITGADNHVRHSFVTRTLDDGIAIESLDLAIVQRQSGHRQVTVNRNANLRFPNGTAFNFVDPISAEELPGATIVSQDPPDSTPPIFGGSVTLTFDRDLPALGPDFGMTLAHRQQRGAGSSVEDNVVEQVPFGRGIWISGAEGVNIEHNEIGPSSNGGIVVSQDTKIFAGPPAHDITIRANKVAGSLGPMASGTGTQIAVGAIIVESKESSSEFASGTPNSHIIIEGNYISDSGRSGIWVGELNSGSIRDNCTLRWNQHPELPVFGVPPQQGVLLRQDFGQPLVVRNSPNVKTLNNSTQPSATCTKAGVRRLKASPKRCCSHRNCPRRAIQRERLPIEAVVLFRAHLCLKARISSRL